MLEKLFWLALVASPVLLPVAVAPVMRTDITEPNPFRGTFATVPKIECAGTVGSGVRISDDLILTARHVAADGPCGIDGKPAEVVHHAEDGIDFSVIRVALGRGVREIISCEGVRPGERYFAYGYAFGRDANVEPLIATNLKLSKGRVALRGRVFPGMSGGAVRNSEGATVAIAVQYNPDVDAANVVDLRNTYLCA